LNLNKRDLVDFASDLRSAASYADSLEKNISIWNYKEALENANELERVLRKTKFIENEWCRDLFFLVARALVTNAENSADERDDYLLRAKTIIDEISLRNNQSPLFENILVLKYLIKRMSSDSSLGLEHISNIDTPFAFRVHIATLLKNQNEETALNLILQKKPNLKWCELAVSVYALTGRIGDALEVIVWAKQQNVEAKYFQCLISFADSSIARVLKRHGSEKSIHPQDLSDGEKEEIWKAVEVLSAIINAVKARDYLFSELEVTALKVAWQGYHLLGEQNRLADITQIMNSWNPVPREVGKSIVLGYIPPIDGFATRIRDEYPEDFEAGVLACFVEAQNRDFSLSYRNAKDLVSMASDEEQKEELFRLFQQLAQNLDEQLADECDQIARPLIEHDPELVLILEAASALRKGDGQKSLDLLESVNKTDDTYLLQLRANALMQIGEKGEAATIFYAVAEKTGSIGLYQAAADLAFESENIQLAIEASLQLVALQPGNLVARGNLARLYTLHLADFEKAFDQFEALYKAEPDNPDHAVNLAVCLVQLYRPHESLTLFEQACQAENPYLQAVLGRNEVLLCLGKEQDAFRRLEKFRSDFWMEPAFVSAFMNTAHAAGEEEAAHEALMQMTALQGQGTVKEGTFRSLQVDDAVELFAKQAEDERTRNEHLHQEMLRGKMPWIWAAQFSGQSVYNVWRSRTQELIWCKESPVNRANYCIYATNGFHSREDATGRRALSPLECSPVGEPVVADLSALITLQRLGLLDRAAEYFGRIMVPQAYLQTVLEDAGKIKLPQKSRQDSAKSILRLISMGLVTVQESGGDGGEVLPKMNEYDESDAHVYRLIDFIEPVFKAGWIDERKYERIRRVCGKPSAVDGDHPELKQLQKLRIELTNLETIAAMGLLDPVAKFYCVHLSEADQKELSNRLEGIQYQIETRTWHFELWDKVRDDSRFEFVSHIVPDEFKQNGMEASDLLGFIATLIARDRKLPLLADDRVSQVFTLNHPENPAAVSFGTDALIQALHREGHLEISEATDAVLNLLRWRYRFIVPSVGVLKELAVRFKSHTPGMELREVAEYLHDCMRDEGLFGGPEVTDLSESMAQRIHLTWIETTAEFLVGIWLDPELDEATSKELTQWCIQEFLPSLPKVMNGRVKLKHANMTQRLLITHVMINVDLMKHPKVGSAALKEIQSALGLSAEEYINIVTEVLEDAKNGSP
jgi:tetratricopeptide (TPR) repeat protein